MAKKTTKDKTQEMVANCNQFEKVVASCDRFEEHITNCDDFEKNEMVPSQYDIERLILTIRGKQVLIDRDLAAIYGVETKRLNEQVRRNIARFPEKISVSADQKRADGGGRKLRPAQNIKVFHHRTICVYGIRCFNATVSSE